MLHCNHRRKSMWNKVKQEGITSKFWGWEKSSGRKAEAELRGLWLYTWARWQKRQKKGWKSIPKAARTLWPHPKSLPSLVLCFSTPLVLLICLSRQICAPKRNTIDLNKNGPKRCFIKTALVKHDIQPLLPWGKSLEEGSVRSIPDSRGEPDIVKPKSPSFHCHLIFSPLSSLWPLGGKRNKI